MATLNEKIRTLIAQIRQSKDVNSDEIIAILREKESRLVELLEKDLANRQIRRLVNLISHEKSKSKDERQSEFFEEFPEAETFITIQIGGKNKSTIRRHVENCTIDDLTVYKEKQLEKEKKKIKKTNFEWLDALIKRKQALTTTFQTAQHAKADKISL